MGGNSLIDGHTLACDKAPVGKGEGLPLPPRCRHGINSPRLPACVPSATFILSPVEGLKTGFSRNRAPPDVWPAYLNPIIRGWSLYYHTCVAKRIFSQLDDQVYRQLTQWAYRRRPRKLPSWRYHRYWRRQGGRLFSWEQLASCRYHRSYFTIFSTGRRDFSTGAGSCG